MPWEALNKSPRDWKVVPNLQDHERYAKCFAGGWCLAGDLAKRDRDG
jgi:hypothetical protein